MSRMQKILLVAVLVVAAFVAGFAWQYARAEGLEGRLATARRELAFTRAETILAAATIAALHGNHDVALQRASEFFTELQRIVASAPPAARPELDAILAQRDATITVLSRAAPESADVLTRMYLRYRVALGGPDQALPLAPQPPAPQPQTPG